jgi:hypothetical protein
MKLIDAINRVKFPQETGRWDFAAPLEEICDALGIGSPWGYSEDVFDELDKRLKAYPICDWRCTDTMVGLYAIYLDGIAVGTSFQSARKSERYFKWVSQESVAKVRSVILSYATQDEDSLIDPDEVIDVAELKYLSGNRPIQVEGE